MFSAALYARVHTLVALIAHEIAGAARIRHSLRPLFEEARKFRHNSGDQRREPHSCACFALTLNPEVRRYGGVTQAPLNPEHHDASHNRFAR